MALTLHYHPLSSFCWKVLIGLYEKDISFDGRIVDFGNPDARAAFTALWPTAKIPLLEDEGRVVPETSIIIEHLDQRYPGKITLLPGTLEEQLECRLWDRLFDLYVMEPMQRFIAQQLLPETERGARGTARALDMITTAYAMIEDRIGTRAWAAGDSFTMADCAAAPALFYAAIVQPFPPGHPRLGDYFERLMARPSVRRVIAEARPLFHHFPLIKLFRNVSGTPSMQLETMPATRLDQLFIALADRNRRAMVDQLSKKPATMSDLARPLGIALPSALKHLAVLENGGVVRSEKAGRTRTYRIAPDAFSGLEAWVAERKAQWNSQFDRLAAYLEEKDG